VYHADEPPPDQRGFDVRGPAPPPPPLRPLLSPEEEDEVVEYEGEEYDPES